jgi:hypothetical protein
MTGLSRRRSRVRVPSLPSNSLQIGIFCCRSRRRRPPVFQRSRAHPARESPLKPGCCSSRNRCFAGRMAGGRLAASCKRRRFAGTFVRWATVLASELGRANRAAEAQRADPLSLRNVVRKSLQRDPANRYADARRMSEDLGGSRIRSSWIQVHDPATIETWRAETADGIYELRVTHRPRADDYHVLVRTRSGLGAAAGLPRVCAAFAHPPLRVGHRKTNGRPPSRRTAGRSRPRRCPRSAACRRPRPATSRRTARRHRGRPPPCRRTRPSRSFPSASP